MDKTYDCADVLLVRLVSSDQSGAKKRPVVVLRDIGDVDLLVLPITSHPSRVVYDVPLADWRAGGLKLPSVVRTEKLATIEKSIVARMLGHLSDRDWRAAQEMLVTVFREIVPD